ncbi:TonB-dependent receptor [Aurantibacillus circumpalustris]|uniref:TonB-dependent receptor n=1 Tax=Aurantibacillus circumpalustris TaxID=3036359 RepID=UPI00295BE277|nr:TonB-dependent receptor [Aurantibacillus circumpalustris]
MFIKKHIFLCGLFLISFLVKSQDCKLILRGVIEDQDNSETLGFAVVKLLKPEMIIQTNDKGEFVFSNLCEGEYQILVQHIGCNDTLFTIKLNKSKKILLKLPHSMNNLDEVDIMDKRTEMKKTQTVEQLSDEEIQKSKGQSLGDVLKNISGVTTLNTGATISKPMVHGMQGYRLLILNNGIRQEGQQWGNEHAPEIDPFIAKKFSVIKGVGAIRYGSDAIAGVVLVEPNELPDTAAMTGEVNLVGLSNGQTGAVSGLLEGSFEKLKGFSWRLQGSMKKGGNVKTPNYFLANTGLEEKNFSYALGYHRKKWGAEMYYSQFNSAIGIFQGSHIGNLTDLTKALQLNKPIDSLAAFSFSIDRPNQVIGHELIKGLTHYHFSSKWRAKILCAWQYNKRQEFDLRRLTTLEKETGKVAPDLDLGITSQTADAILEHDNIKAFRGIFGLSYMNQKNIYSGRFFIPNYISNSFGVFATERYVKRYIEMEVGIRYDEKHLQSYFYEGKDWKEHLRTFKNSTYNAGVIWKPNSVFNLFVNAGSAWRAPAPNELYSNGIHQGAATIERGNPDFKSETCYNLTATGIYKTKKLNLELSAYYNRFENFIYLSPSGELELTIRGAFPVFVYKQDKVKISGLDFKSNYLINNYFSFGLKGMIVRAWNYSISDYLIYMPSDRLDLNFKFKIPGKKMFQNTYFQINNQFVAKQWRSPLDVDFAPAPNGYSLLGLDLGTEVQIKKQKLLINLSATNLLNARYREYLDRFRYYADAIGVSYNVRITIPLLLYKKTN